MKIIALSDSHGSLHNVEQILDAAGDVDFVLFCGDGLSDIESAEYLYPKPVYATVAGNCDRGARADYEKLLELNGLRILLTHGHAYDVKQTLTRLHRRAVELNADLVFFGHTHRPLDFSIDGVRLVNPGSCSAFPQYAQLLVENEKPLSLRLIKL